MLREPPQQVVAAVSEHVLRDLEPPALLVHVKVGISAIVGGVASLMLCGQFGFGVTSWAEALNHRMHAHLGSVPCAVACGVMFSIFPVLVLRFLLAPPLQFRAILRRHQLVMVIWFAGLGGALAFFGEHGQGIVELSSWLVAALAAANVCARVADRLSPSWLPPLAWSRSKA